MSGPPRAFLGDRLGQREEGIVGRQLESPDSGREREPLRQRQGESRIPTECVHTQARLAVFRA